MNADALALLPNSPAPLAPADLDLFTRWQDLGDDWLATRRTDRTRRTYAEALTAFFGHIGKAPWAVTRADVASWAEGLRLAGLADATIANRLAALSAFYQHAQAEGLAERNPVAGVPRPRVEPYGHAVALSRDQAARVLSSISRETPAGRRDYAMMLLQLTTGLRRAELVNVLAGDLVETPAGAVVLTYRPKGGDQVTRELPRAALAPLREYLADRGPLAPADPVFVAHDHGSPRRQPRPLTAEAWRLIVAKYTRAALGRSIHPHALRHTAATLAWERTRDLKQVQGLLGHKHVTTTQRYIDHVEDARARLGDDLAALLGVAL